MKEKLQSILSKLPQVEYGDVRIVDTQSEDIATKDGVVEALAASTSQGYAVRLIDEGQWGFAASHDFSEKGIDATIKKAIEMAHSAASVPGNSPILLDTTKPVKGSYKTYVEKDPFTVPMEKKLELLLAADRAQRVNDKIVISQTSFTAKREKKYFASTHGSLTDQEIVITGVGLEASAASTNDFQNRSFPNSHGGQYATKGYELVESLALIEKGSQMGEEAVELLDAPQCPTGQYDIILDSNQLALQIHESCGHAVELDRVLGYEASYAGTSFLTPDNLNKLQYGSPIVNLTADATIPGGLGTFGFDDEGVPAQRTYLVKNGLFVDYITSRETVRELKKFVPSYNKNSNGTMRGSLWSRLPLIRMTNINLEPGKWKLDDLIADTREGIFMSTNRSWSIDDRRLNFQFGTEIAWEIKNGKKGRILKNPTYQGITPQFWNSCDAICGRDEWIVWGTPNCGKGQPSQVINTGHGAAPARFRNIKVGVVKKW